MARQQDRDEMREQKKATNLESFEVFPVAPEQRIFGIFVDFRYILNILRAVCILQRVNSLLKRMCCGSNCRDHHSPGKKDTAHSNGSEDIGCGQRDM